MVEDRLVVFVEGVDADIRRTRIIVLIERPDTGLALILDILAILQQSEASLVGIALLATISTGNRSHIGLNGLAVGAAALLRGEGCEDDCPAGCVSACSLCHDLLDESQTVRIPGYLLEEAGIPADAKLDAYSDEDSGEITVTEADIQQDITDVPPGILAVLAQSGMCLAELDELIMQEEIIYGR